MTASDLVYFVPAHFNTTAYCNIPEYWGYENNNGILQTHSSESEALSAAQADIDSGLFN